MLRARDIAAGLKVLPQTARAAQWVGLDEFRTFDGLSMRNGLGREEQATLARTAHVDEAVALNLRGLLRLSKPAGGTA